MTLDKKTRRTVTRQVAKFLGLPVTSEVVKRSVDEGWRLYQNPPPLSEEEKQRLRKIGYNI